MAINTTTRLAGPYAGNGVTAVFPFAFKVVTASDVAAEVTNSSGGLSTLVFGVDYTVSLSANQDANPGGNITLTAPLAAGLTMTITSAMPGLQTTVLTNLGGFFPDVLNAALDKLTILVQQIQLSASRALNLPLGEAANPSLPPASQRAGQFLSFDQSGNAIVAQPPPGTPGTPGLDGQPGTTTYNGSSGPFAVNGTMNAGRVYAAPSGPLNIAYPNNYQESGSIVANTVFGGGGNIGYSGGVVQGGWTLVKSLFSSLTVLTRGIASAYSVVFNKFAFGDTQGLDITVNYTSGVLAGADEGVTLFRGKLNEFIPFQGIVSATTGTGDTQPALTYTPGPNAQFQANQCADQSLLVNLSKGTLSGSLNGAATQFQGTPLNTVPVTGVSLPVSVAWGTAGAVAQTGQTADVGVSVTIPVTLGGIGGVARAFTVGIVSVGGLNFSERSFITSVGAASEGVQNITLKLRYPNNSMVLFQGGIAGQCISSDANLALTGVRSAYRAFGSLTGSDMVHGLYAQGGTGNDRTMPQPGAEAFTSSGANAGFHLYPYAEVVRNTSAGVPAPVLEPNSIAWAVGDSVVNAYADYGGGAAATLAKTQNTPTYATFGNQGVQIAVGGMGVGTTRFDGLQIGNYTRSGIGGRPFYYGQTNSAFPGAYGPIDAPTAISLQGIWGRFIEILEAPLSLAGQAILTIVNLANGNTDTGLLRVVALPRGAGVSWAPLTDTWQIGSLSVYNLSAASMMLSGTETAAGYSCSNPYGATFTFAGLTSLPSTPGATLGGLYFGLCLQTTDTAGTNPVFVVCTSERPGQFGLGKNPFTVLCNGTVRSFRNTLDDGAGNAAVVGSLAVTNALSAGSLATGQAAVTSAAAATLSIPFTANGVTVYLKASTTP